MFTKTPVLPLALHCPQDAVSVARQETLRLRETQQAEAAKARDEVTRLEQALVKATEQKRASEAEHSNGMRARDLELQNVKQQLHEAEVSEPCATTV